MVDRNSTPATPNIDGGETLLINGELTAAAPVVEVSFGVNDTPNFLRLFGDSANDNIFDGGTLTSLMLTSNQTAVTLEADDGEDFLITGTGFGIANIDAVISAPDGEFGTFTFVLQRRTQFSGEDELILTSSAESEWIAAEDGDDYVVASAGLDVYEGGTGFDTLDYADSTAAITLNLESADFFFSGTRAIGLFNTPDLYSEGGFAEGQLIFGFEQFIGSDFDDTFNGSRDDEVFEGGLGADTFNGGSGDDSVSYQNADQAVSVNLQTGVGTGAASGDTFNSIEGVIGSEFADAVTGDVRNNTINGLGGADVIDGGNGFDTASYAGSDTGVSVNLGGLNTGGDAQGDVLTNIEGVLGSDFDDTLTGDDSANSLVGGEGNDTLLGDGVRSLSVDSLEGQVFRAFQAVFDRAPDEGGFNANLTELRIRDAQTPAQAEAQPQGLSQAEIIERFVISTEFQNTFGALNNREFTEQLFRNIFDREGDEGGVNAFTAALDGGRSRASVVTELANSPEFVQLLSIQSAAFATNVIINPVEAQVYRIFQAVFLRDPDDSGFPNFTNSIQAGAQTVGEVTAQFVSGAEFQQTYGDLENAEFVDLLFTNVLPGNTDPVGRAAFTAALDAGEITRAEIVTEFVDSREFVQRTNDAAIEFVADAFASSGDVLDGGLGNDLLVGGRGADRFVFDAGNGGQDIIADFTSGTDTLDIRPDFDSLDSPFFEFEEVLAVGAQEGQDTVFDFGNGNTLTLENVTLSELSGVDFGFFIG